MRALSGDTTVGSACRYATDVSAYREALRTYLNGIDWTDEWRRPSTSTADAMNHDAAVLRRLSDEGWNRYGWPVKAGGLGGDVLHRAVFYEELAYAMLPVPAQQWTTETLAPVLLALAPELAQRHLPSCLDGSQWWGQCFSEVEDRSDLTTLETRAVAHGDGYTITGRNSWTIQGPGASRFLVLARTGTTDLRHGGLTTFMVEADAPGVTVRPIVLASGREEIAEVVFDEVRVGPNRVVGEIGGGWAVVMFVMQFERGMRGYARLTKALTELGRLRVDMIERGNTQSERDRFTRTYLNVAMAQARCASTVRALATGEQLGPDSGVDELLASQAERESFDLIFDMRQDWVTGRGVKGAHTATELAAIRAEWWYSRDTTVMGGTSEAQRGIVADHLLGLPRETL